MVCVKMLISIVAVALLPLVASFPTFRNKIPNGWNVLNPCDRSPWPGVGHEASAGAGPRNPFGKDFAANGYTWTVALCQKDSDGDGVSNGVELGDKDCEWSVTNNITLPVPTGHPDGPLSCVGSTQTVTPCQTGRSWWTWTVSAVSTTTLPSLHPGTCQPVGYCNCKKTRFRCNSRSLR